MNDHEFRRWARENAATRCIGTLVLTSGTERQAVLAVTSQALLAAVPYGSEAVIYRQAWDGQQWRTQTVGEFPFSGRDLDSLYDHLFTCPRCDGSGQVWLVETDEAGHHVKTDVPCPHCGGEETADDLPF